MAQSILDIVYIWNMHVEANYSHCKVEECTIAHDMPNQPHGKIAINITMSVYNKPSVLMVLKDVQTVCP